MMGSVTLGRPVKPFSVGGSSAFQAATIVHLVVLALEVIVSPQSPRHHKGVNPLCRWPFYQTNNRLFRGEATAVC
jgi:hypothetical protein